MARCLPLPNGAGIAASSTGITLSVARRGPLLPLRPPQVLLGLLLVALPAGCLPGPKTGMEGLSRLEQEEVTFMRSSLKREMEELGGGFQFEGAEDDREKAIRRAYRNIARRYKRNIFSDPDKFEFQMRILNLARDHLVQGEHLGADGWGGGGDEDSNETVGPGHELGFGSRASDEILKQMHSWQEYGLEEGVHFDDPEKPYFAGHTQHGFREAFSTNWTNFVREELSSVWPAAANLHLQVELDATADGGGSGPTRPRARSLAEAERQLARDAVAAIAGTVLACGGRDPPLEGPLPANDDTEAWVDLQLRTSRNLRGLFAGGRSGQGPCNELADLAARLAVLEMSLEALEHLSAEDGEAPGRADVAAELRATHAATAALRSEAMSEHCRDVATLKRAALEKLWEDYQFGAVAAEAYPVDACALEGLSAFLEFHIGPTGELLEQRAEPDKTVLKAVRSLLALQRALARPASLSSAQWRDAVGDLEDAVWQGVAFPELHEATGKLLGELANAGLLSEILEATLEHPPIKGGPAGATLRLGKEPGEIHVPRTPRFVGLDVPGYSMKPIQRYEERALHLWGDEEVEERWDPVRMGLSYIDLTPACDLPLQVAMCFISAALWLWRALQLLGDNCGGDGWLEDYIFEDLWSVPPESKRLAMQFSLKRAIFELVDYASLMAESQLLPGPRLTVQHAAYLLLRKVAARFGSEEDAPKVLEQVKRMLMAARVSPVWSPPVLLVSDAVFVDILSGRLHQSFMETLHQAPETAAQVLPSAVAEYTLYEAALLGAGDTTNVTYARFELMGALLHDSGRSWDDVKTAFGVSPLPLDAAGFAAGPRPGRLSPTEMRDLEFAAVTGLRIDMASGRASLLLAHPAVAPSGGGSGGGGGGGAGAGLPALALIGVDDLAGILGIADSTPLHLSLDPPVEKGAGAARYPHHTFQRAVSGPAGTSRKSEVALLHAALAVQQVAAGTEAAQRAPFPLRRCAEGLCRGLPPGVAREHLQPLGGLRGESWETPPRLVLECARLPYWQRMDGGVLEVRFGTPALEVHPGKPLRVLNLEEFRTWPVAKLRKALQRLRATQELPALEKHELVETLVKAVQDGALLEDEEELGDPLVRFSRRLTHHLGNVSEHWPHVGRLSPLCAARAAGLVLRMQLEQLTETATEQRDGLRANAEAHAEGMRHDQAEGWRGVLAEVHGRVLQELGFVDLNPGQCFSGEGGGSR
eukprot:CAMPEP_0115429882 /NCGR_PEP_ID=MMETSP0271-20121206/30752_1 /TAXON_ID=71861 /ORGANISM="Scrippsiella trochoidea, Strain CCMP3099" /LENGTH=1216 /DNA_ID=CAMNT_0002855081 /DNA_START=83 /DNA_END=3729 /DNA_ORIENTATION=+